ncbi:MAG: EVE domain-containing protein [Candidatus Latescibacterota bacterium]|nr:MAG: EVE domain-containing protein [Candidatus Latescibacterota bacterium]
MACWLLKADPADYGYADLERDRRTAWDGVSNNLALKHMRSVRKGDRVLLYHSGSEKAVVGLVEVVSDPYPDPESQDERLVVFDVAARKRLKRSVRLAEIKADSRFAQFPLVRMPRLSVMPVPAPLWTRLVRMAGEKE